MDYISGEGPTNKTDLSELNDFQIFTILLAHLYMKYDHGGYSFRRSIQSDAVEFRTFIPHCGFAQDYTGNLDVEIKKRIEAAKNTPSHLQQLVFNLGPSTLTTPELIQYCLKNLVWWYKHHAEENGFLDVESPRMVNNLYELHLGIYGDIAFNHPTDLPTLSALIIETNDRITWYLQEEYKYHEYKTLTEH